MARKTPGKKSGKKSCSICAATGSESFRYMRSLYRFDVDLARKIVADGRQPVEIAEEDVEFSVRTSRIYDDHVAHVNIKYPGIVAHIYFKPPRKPAAHGHLLIDGHHRGAKCLRLGKPFYAYLLTELESEQVLIKHPPGAVGHAKRRRRGLGV